MKTYLKVLTILLFASIVQAACSKNPTTTETRGNEMIETLSKKIALTDSQLVVLRQKAMDMFAKRDSAAKQSISVNAFSMRSQAQYEFTCALDSILTPEQKDQLNKALEVKDPLSGTKQ